MYLRQLLALGLPWLLMLMLAACDDSDNDTDSDNEPPKITIEAPDTANAPIQREAEQSVELILALQDDSGLDSLQVAVSPQGWQFQYGRALDATSFRDTTNMFIPASVPSGTYVIDIDVWDGDGNRANAALEVAVSNDADATAPELSIDVPTDQQSFTQGDTIRVAGSASDNAGLSQLAYFLKRSGDTVTEVFDNAAAGQTNYPINQPIARADTLSPGSYTLEIQAGDQSNNFTTASRTIQVTQ
jgi:hypothetical protein